MKAAAVKLVLYESETQDSRIMDLEGCHTSSHAKSRRCQSERRTSGASDRWGRKRAKTSRRKKGKGGAQDAPKHLAAPAPLNSKRTMPPTRRWAHARDAACSLVPIGAPTTTTARSGTFVIVGIAGCSAITIGYSGGEARTHFLDHEAQHGRVAPDPQAPFLHTPENRCALSLCLRVVGIFVVVVVGIFVVGIFFLPRFTVLTAFLSWVVSP